MRALRLQALHYRARRGGGSNGGGLVPVTDAAAAPPLPEAAVVEQVTQSARQLSQRIGELAPRVAWFFGR